MHGKYPKLLQSDEVDRVSSLMWLAEKQLYPETEGFVMAIQDRVIKTKNYEKHCLKLDVVDRCRKCGTIGETIEHIMAACPTLADTAYMGRHNQLSKIIHQQIALKYNLLRPSTPPYYKYSPEAILESLEYLLYWDRPITTDRTVDYNRPDIVLVNKKEKFGVIIDIAVPLSHNIQKTEIEKVTKYENLAYELKNLWKLRKVTVYPFVMSVEGIVTNNFLKNLKELELPKNILNVGQRAILLQTTHIVRKFLG